ncbi:MAG: hypothetical protein ACW98X_19595 [Promethearchaeota archaeon]
MKLIILFLISIIPTALYNYFFDPFGIFNDTSINLGYEPGYEPNQHYAKMRHLINGDHLWDSYLFGSSRVGKINPDLIPDGNYYNMNYSEGIPSEHLVDIKILLEKGIPVKNVIIGLDNSSYMIRPEDHIDQIMRHRYDVSALKRFIFQIKYLCSVPRLSIIKYIASSNNDSLMSFDIIGNGMQRLEKVDKNIEQDIERHVNSTRFSIPKNIPLDKATEEKYMKYMEYTIQEITEIAKLSKKHNFKLFFFINPLHKLRYLQENPYLFLVFKKKLAEIIDYWDFSGFNSVTTDNYYYYELSHYRTIVGDLIICRIKNCTDVKVPNDFGLFITRENVNDLIKKQEERLIAYNAANLKTDE